MLIGLNVVLVVGSDIPQQQGKNATKSLYVDIEMCTRILPLPPTVP